MNYVINWVRLSLGKISGPIMVKVRGSVVVPYIVIKEVTFWPLRLMMTRSSVQHGSDIHGEREHSTHGARV